jgi:hypothetical protein
LKEEEEGEMKEEEATCQFGDKMEEAVGTVGQNPHEMEGRRRRIKHTLWKEMEEGIGRRECQWKPTMNVEEEADGRRGDGRAIGAVAVAALEFRMEIGVGVAGCGFAALLTGSHLMDAFCLHLLFLLLQSAVGPVLAADVSTSRWWPQ